ncbi:MAG: DUF3135 domain-containing protein [Agarilytica sp.]
MHNDWPSFEELRRMAEQCPEKLEAFRNRQVEALIAAEPIELRRRLRGLQFQINCQRELHESPMASCIAISNMMHQSLQHLQQTLNGPHQTEEKTVLNDNVFPLF